MSERVLKAGIAINSWKLPMFEKRLTEAGYSFDKVVGEGIVILRVFYASEELPTLSALIKRINREAANLKPGSMVH